MRRAPLVIAGTVAGLAGVLAYHPAHASVSGGLLAVAGTPTQTTAQQTATTPASTTPASTTPASTATPSRAGAGVLAPAKSATGVDAQYPYGDLQLKVTVTGAKVTGVQVVKWNVTDPRSQSIDQYAIPLLRQETLSAGSAQIDGVSGASYTSQAYAQSLQSALDKLGAGAQSQAKK
jgi:uncharacterized protein with FMN-binding domain